MARNEEKAQSMLNRYLREKKGDDGRGSKRRPYLATLCEDVDEAQQWRGQIVRDIRRRVAEIQNPGLGDERVRELNDLINKLLREKKHWERRIAFLGGPRFVSTTPADTEVFESGGYFYFGAARDLPGVRDLIERERDDREEREKRQLEESSTELYRRVNDYYYGKDGMDEETLREECRMETKLRKQLMVTWEKENEGKMKEFGPDAEWDESFLQYVGRKPEVATSESLELLALERKKMDALELLHASVRENK